MIRRIIHKLKLLRERCYPMEEQAKRAGVSIGSNNDIASRFWDSAEPYLNSIGNKSDNMKERILLFDIMKALCVVEIIAFWHMLDYTPLVETKVPYGEQLIGIVLSAFTFASGFFLGKKNLNALTFYKARIIFQAPVKRETVDNILSGPHPRVLPSPFPDG